MAFPGSPEPLVDNFGLISMLSVPYLSPGFSPLHCHSIHKINLRTIRTTTAIALGIGGVIAYHFWEKSRAAKAMNFFPAGVQQIKFDGATPVITLALSAHNASSQEMTVNAVDLNLTANGTYVGNASSFVPQTILANSQTTVFVDIRLSLLSVVNDIIKAFQYGNFSQVIRLTGVANVDNIQVPIDMNFTVG